jgi:peroxiredoxin
MINQVNTWLLAGTILAAPLSSLAQQGTFHIQGQAALLAKPAGNAPRKPWELTHGMAYLHRYTLETGVHEDSCTAVDGKFSFSGPVQAPEFCTILFANGGGTESIYFYLEPGNITVQCPDDGTHATVTGTPLNKDFQEYKNSLNHYIDSLNESRPGQKPYYQYSPEVQAGKLQIVTAFLERHPSSPVSLYELDQYAGKNPQPDVDQRLFDQLSRSLRDSKDGIQLADRIKGMNAGNVGDAAPAFTLLNTEGKEVSLSDFKGKYVLIDFWATWCVPCLNEMPNVAKAYHTYKEKNFVVVGISLDRPDSRVLWQKTIKRDTMDWPQVSDFKWWNSKAALAYHINSVPANFLVDPSGKIIAKNLRGEALQAKLKELFN